MHGFEKGSKSKICQSLKSSPLIRIFWLAIFWCIVLKSESKIIPYSFCLPGKNVFPFRLLWCAITLWVNLIHVVSHSIMDRFVKVKHSHISVKITAADRARHYPKGHYMQTTATIMVFEMWFPCIP